MPVVCIGAAICGVSIPKRTLQLLHFDVFRRFLALVGNEFVFDYCAFIEGGQARPLNGGDMHEHIFAAALRLNEAISLSRIEPLHCTCWHYQSPFFTLTPDIIALLGVFLYAFAQGACLSSQTCLRRRSGVAGPAVVPHCKPKGRMQYILPPACELSKPARSTGRLGWFPVFGFGGLPRFARN
jgi:hypothetical protein